MKSATKHPAKFSRNLIYWIVQTGIQRGYWCAGDTILDPFAGVGLGALACHDIGLCWVGVELEERFVEIARQNFDLNASDWVDKPIIIQGDSRKLQTILPCGFRGAVTSPPFSTIETSVRKKMSGEIADLWGRVATVQNQGQTPGNLASLVGIQRTPQSMAALLTDQDDTYWSAALKIYQAVYRLLSEGGVMAVVVKDLVRNKQRIPIADLTQQALEVVGFKPIGVTFAMQVSEDGTKEYKHFFRRDWEKKGSPRIDWENVLWVRKEGCRD